MSYLIEWNPRALNAAARFLKDDPEGLQQVFTSVDFLAAEPRPEGSFPYGSDNLRRIRIGRYRVLYEIHDSTISIQVLKLGQVP
ncbi:type II toxin-antitoxin system RelE family toxin [Streptomyces carpaticus]|uniref:Type II toxin-antitoxin system RelE/ParE family toxin n=1 Tax=Streptomyces carpaticus TaxID=285558 RepID=A0ABV4ZNF1_9ACTN